MNIKIQKVKSINTKVKSSISSCVKKGDLSKFDFTKIDPLLDELGVSAKKVQIKFQKGARVIDMNVNKIFVHLSNSANKYTANFSEVSFRPTIDSAHFIEKGKYVVTFPHYEHPITFIEIDY